MAAILAGVMAGCGGSGGSTAPAPIPENEAIDQRTNDQVGSAVAIRIGDAATGTIGLPAQTADVDRYRFSAAAGQVVRVTVSVRDTGDYQPRFHVSGEALGSRVGRFLEDPSEATRQIYIPETGDYVVSVSDARNESSAEVGGESCTYRLEVAAEALSVAPASLPLTTGSIDPRGSLQAFRVTLPAGAVRIETRAARLEPASGVDTILALIEGGSNAGRALAWNDDMNVFEGTDSRILHPLESGGTFLVLLDFYALRGTSLGYELTIDTSYDPQQEIEPNEGGTTNPISVGGPAVRGTIDRIDSGTGSQAGDEDRFEFPAAADGYYEIVVTKPAGSNAAWVPRVRTDAGIEMSPGETVLRYQTFTSEAGPVTVSIHDARNDGLDSGFLGGADFTYTVQVLALPLPVHQLGGFPVLPSDAAADAIDVAGRWVFYVFDVPGGAGGPAQDAWIDLDLSPGNGADGSRLDPYLTLYGPDGEFLDGRATYMLREVLLPGRHTLRVRDFENRSSPDHHRFRPRIVTLGEVPTYADTGGHGTQASALPAALGAATGKASMSGVLAAGGQSWFALGTFGMGDRLSAASDLSTCGDDADVVLSVIGQDGNVVANSEASCWPRIPTAALPWPQAYYLKVENAGAGGTGAFRVHAAEEGCMEPARIDAGTLSINEVLVRPVSPGGDANRDGTVSAVADPFVEIVNSVRRITAISGVTLRTLSGTRYQAACDRVLDEFQALTVFGQCGAGRCSPGFDQTNVDPNAPRFPPSDGLAINPGGDTLMLLDREGRLIDRIDLPSDTPNVSFARGAGGTCDLPGASVVQPETACAQAACTTAPCFTPGVKANGNLFGPPPRPAGDVCATAAALVADTPVDGATDTTFTNDYDVSVGTSASCSVQGTIDGVDRAYGIVVPAGRRLTITVTPQTDWDPAVAIVSDCASAGVTCHAFQDRGMNGDPETVQYTNSTAAPLSLYVLVDSYTTSASGSGPFRILATLDVPPPAPQGDVCATATPLVAGTPLDSAIDASYANDYDVAVDASTLCSPVTYAPRGRDRAFAITIPAGRTLTVTVTPRSSWDPALAVVTDCASAGPSCLGFVDVGVSGAAETVGYANTTAGALPVYVLVDSYTLGTSGAGPFTLSATLAP
jgi:hypothetical protein